MKKKFSQRECLIELIDALKKSHDWDYSDLAAIENELADYGFQAEEISDERAEDLFTGLVHSLEYTIERFSNIRNQAKKIANKHFKYWKVD